MLHGVFQPRIFILRGNYDDILTHVFSSASLAVNFMTTSLSKQYHFAFRGRSDGETQFKFRGPIPTNSLVEMTIEEIGCQM